MTGKTITMAVHPQEARLLNKIRTMGYGELKIKAQNNLPVRIYERITDIDLTKDEIKVGGTE